MLKLLDEKKLGDFLSFGVELDEENEEIGIFLASADVSAACGFKYDEWEAFVEGVLEAHNKYKEVKK